MHGGAAAAVYRGFGWVCVDPGGWEKSWRVAGVWRRSGGNRRFGLDCDPHSAVSGLPLDLRRSGADNLWRNPWPVHESAADGSLGWGVGMR